MRSLISWDVPAIHRCRFHFGRMVAGHPVVRASAWFWELALPELLSAFSLTNI